MERFFKPESRSDSGNTALQHRDLQYCTFGPLTLFLGKLTSTLDNQIACMLANIVILPFLSASSLAAAGDRSFKHAQIKTNFLSPC